MPAYYKRYRNGECEGVWDELNSLGEDVRREPLFSEAQSVAREFVDRCRRNLRLLQGRLQDLGYEFASPENVLREPTNAELRQLSEIDEEFGPLPIVYRTWYESFGSVDFRQATHQLQNYDSITPQPGPEVYGLGSHPVLLFLSLDDAFTMKRDLDAENAEAIREAKELGHYVSEMEQSSPFIPLGGWASNCEPKGLELPDRKFDAVIYNDGGGDMRFGDELRIAFRWGGFPFWSRLLTKKDFYSPFEFKPDFPKLLPNLRRDLVVV